MELYDALLSRLDIDSLSNLYLTDKTWHTYINSNLSMVALCTELPHLTTFSKIYMSSWWSANELLHYSNITKDIRLAEIAYARYAVKPVEISNFYISFTKIKFTLESAYKFIFGQSITVRCVKMFQKLMSDQDITPVDFRDRIKDIEAGFHWKLLHEKNYELVIYLILNGYIRAPRNKIFREFCVNRCLNDLVNEISGYMIDKVVKETKKSRDIAKTALERYDWDVLDAILSF